MALSAAEKMRKLRQKRNADPVLRAEYLKKEKERSTKRRRSVEQMTRREHKAQKSKWREIKRQQRQKIKELKKIMTPPMSPSEDQELVAGPSRQRTEARRQRRRQRSAVFKQNIILQQKLEIETRRAEMYKKRLGRAKLSRSSGQSHDVINPEETPRTRTRKLLRFSSGKTVRKTLLFHNVLLDELRIKYQKAGVKEKRKLYSLTAGSILKKYKLRVHARAALNIRGRKSPKKSIFRTSLTRRLQKTIQSFFERDDNSRITTAKKQTVTFRKIKKQKRLLNDSVKNLHKKFLAENPSVAVSYATFWRLKPFWVKQPTEHERETCLCKLHENFRFVVNKLHSLEVLDDSSIENVLKKAACKTDSKLCMYGDCRQCNNFTINLPGMDQNQSVTWFQWTNVKEMRDVKNVGRKEVSVTKRNEESGSLSDLLQRFYEQLPRFKRHHFNMKNQFLHYRNLHDGLTEKECMLHIDFAENYIGKMNSEVQSMHFGASKSQITLHTAVLYMHDGHKCICTVSDSLEHGPAAVWAHLRPILKDLRKSYPEVETIHFYSDGPTSQYRQKGNFYLFSVLPFEMGFKSMTWNFFEAGHGKGAPDGVGGVLKRRADELVRCGKSIMDAHAFISMLQEAGTEIKLYKVDRKDISSVEKIKKFSTLQPVPGTMRIHQLISVSPGTISYRDISCTCEDLNTCRNHECSQATFPVKRFNSTVFRTMHCKKRKTNTVAASTVPNVNIQLGDTRKAYFAQVLKDLSSCRSYQELQEMCVSISETLEYDIHGEKRCIMETMLEVDVDAMEIYPKDAPSDSEPVYPVKVKADGDCLAHAGSVYAFGNELSQDEVRSRIVMELVNCETLYLSQDYLIRGLQSSKKVPKNIAGNYVQYSEQFLPGVQLTADSIRSIFQNEVMTVRHSRKYMGIWQMFALSSVLEMKIFSVYPQLGNRSVREDLHRLILPRCPCTRNETVQIMWTSTRTSDMNTTHWVPNHFVPVLPVDFVQMSPSNVQPNDRPPGSASNATSLYSFSSDKLPACLDDLPETAGSTAFDVILQTPYTAPDATHTEPFSTSSDRLPQTLSNDVSRQTLHTAADGTQESFSASSDELPQSPLTVSDVYPIELLPTCTEDFPQTASTDFDTFIQTLSTAPDVISTDSFNTSIIGLTQTPSAVSDAIAPMSSSVSSDVLNQTPSTALGVNHQNPSSASDVTTTEPISVSSDGLHQTLSTASDTIPSRSPSVPSDVASTLPFTALDVSCHIISTAADATPAEPVSVSSDGLIQTLSTASDVIAPTSSSVTSDLINQIPSTALDVNPQTPSTATDVTTTEPISVSSDGLHQTLCTASDTISPRSPSVSSDVASTLPYTALDVSCQTISTAADATPAEPVSVSSDGLIQTLSTATDVIAPTSSSVTSDLINQIPSTALDVNPQTPSTATDVTTTEPISVSSDGLRQTLSTAADTISSRSPSVSSDVASTLPYTALDVSCQTISTAADATSAEPVSVSSDGLIQTLSTASDVIPPRSSSASTDGLPQSLSTVASTDNQQTSNTSTIASRVNTVNDHSLRKVCISAKPKTFNDLKRELPMPEELVGKHVIVLYDGSAYPGKVLDVYEKQELYVECMQQIVKKQNCFIWPKLKDRCWYDYGTSVVALIPKPKAMVANEKPGHRQVDPEIWKIVMQELNK